ncbi:MAG TPA: hypothetical protein VK436_09395 [Methanocella sp.]|nr:hypothetical protein [Methanocella sp.]
MDPKYIKAVRAGLVGALLLVVIYIVIHVVFYWAVSKPSVLEWVQNQSAESPTPYPTGLSQLPSEVLVAGVAVCGGALMIFAVYFFVGVLAAKFTVSMSQGAIDLLLLGALAGAVAQGVSAPFTELIAIVLNGGVQGDIISWFLRFLLSEYVIFMIIAVVPAALAALVAGAMFKAFGTSKKE